MTKPMRSLDLGKLSDQCPNMTASAIQGCAEAAAVCLTEVPHLSGVVMRVTGKHSESYSMSWPAVTAQMSRTHADPDEATELGACGVAFHLIRDLESRQVIERSRKGTGFDYWLGEDGDDPFQNKARLEISGIRRAGSRSAVAQRVKQKRLQTMRSDAMSIPAYIIVVEFSGPLAHIEERR